MALLILAVAAAVGPVVVARTKTKTESYAQTPVRFAVLHANGAGSDPLAELINHVTTPSSDLSLPAWLYDEFPRWDREHAERLWRFDCGPVSGQPTAAMGRCRKRHTYRGELPGAVGFGLDLNLLLAPGSDVVSDLAHAKARVVVLTIGNLGLAALRDAAYGSVPQAVGFAAAESGTAWGRSAGTARSQFRAETPAMRTANRRRRLRSYNRRQQVMRGNALCRTQLDAAGLVAGVRHQQAERDALALAITDMRRSGVAVLDLSLDLVIVRPKEALDLLWDFLVPDAPPPSTQSDQSTRRGSWRLPQAALDGCVDTVREARIQMVVDNHRRVSQPLVEDLSQTLTVIERRKLHHDHHQER